MLFIEHGRLPDCHVVRRQDRRNPLGRRVAGGGNLNRQVNELITSSGFSKTEVTKGYAPGPKPFHVSIPRAGDSTMAVTGSARTARLNPL